MDRAPFITDNGGPVDIFHTPVSGNIPVLVASLPRYGVWVYSVSRHKHEVSECGNDLAALQATHGVPDERVFTLKKGITP